MTTETVQTFAEFVATRRRLTLAEYAAETGVDLTEDYGVESTAETPRHALTYAGGYFIIEEGEGHFWLILERDEYTGTDLSAMERRLYEFQLETPAEIEPAKPEPRRIDITPTWSGILPALIAIMRDGTHEGQRLAEIELRRMATLADNWVAHCKATGDDTAR